MANQYWFQVRLTPMGKHYVEIMDGFTLVGVSRKTYPSGEAAIHDMQEALELRRLADAIIQVDPPAFTHSVQV